MKNDRLVDFVGLSGVGAIGVGTAILSIPWALIVVGTILLALSVYGAHRK